MTTETSEDEVVWTNERDLSCTWTANDGFKGENDIPSHSDRWFSSDGRVWQAEHGDEDEDQTKDVEGHDETAEEPETKKKDDHTVKKEKQNMRKLLILRHRLLRQRLLRQYYRQQLLRQQLLRQYYRQ